MSDCSAIVFAGMHKLTLLDYPDKTACTLFTKGCNLACPFCHNRSLIPFAHASTGSQPPDTLTDGHIFDFLEKRQGLLDGVCISGGESLAHEGILELALKVKELGFLVKIDTNGSYPERLKQLVQAAAVDYVAMDIKNSLGKYAQTVGIKGYDTAPVEESIAYLLAGKVPCEFRTTVVYPLHEPGDLLSIARMIVGAERYFLQNYKKQDDESYAAQYGFSAFGDEQMQEMLRKVREILPNASLRT